MKLGRRDTAVSDVDVAMTMLAQGVLNYIRPEGTEPLQFPMPFKREPQVAAPTTAEQREAESYLAAHSALS